MKPRWEVVVPKLPSPSPYADGHFPRGFAYKKDAQKCADRVNEAGGLANVEKHSSIRDADNPRPAPH